MDELPFDPLAVGAKEARSRILALPAETPGEVFRALYTRERGSEAWAGGRLTVLGACRKRIERAPRAPGVEAAAAPGGVPEEPGVQAGDDVLALIRGSKLPAEVLSVLGNGNVRVRLRTGIARVVELCAREWEPAPGA
jgi:hypothetical protein